MFNYEKLAFERHFEYVFNDFYFYYYVVVLVLGIALAKTARLMMFEILLATLYYFLLFYTIPCLITSISGESSEDRFFSILVILANTYYYKVLRTISSLTMVVTGNIYSQFLIILGDLSFTLVNHFFYNSIFEQNPSLRLIYYIVNGFSFLAFVTGLLVKKYSSSAYEGYAEVMDRLVLDPTCIFHFLYYFFSNLSSVLGLVLVVLSNKKILWKMAQFDHVHEDFQMKIQNGKDCPYEFSLLNYSITECNGTEALSIVVTGNNINHITVAKVKNPAHCLIPSNVSVLNSLSEANMIEGKNSSLFVKYNDMYFMNIFSQLNVYNLSKVYTKEYFGYDEMIEYMLTRQNYIKSELLARQLVFYTPMNSKRTLRRLPLNSLCFLFTFASLIKFLSGKDIKSCVSQLILMKKRYLPTEIYINVRDFREEVIQVDPDDPEDWYIKTVMPKMKMTPMVAEKQIIHREKLSTTYHYKLDRKYTEDEVKGIFDNLGHKITNPKFQNVKELLLNGESRVKLTKKTLKAFFHRFNSYRNDYKLFNPRILKIISKDTLNPIKLKYSDEKKTYISPGKLKYRKAKEFVEPDPELIKQNQRKIKELRKEMKSKKNIKEKGQSYYDSELKRLREEMMTVAVDVEVPYMEPPKELLEFRKTIIRKYFLPI
jgi:hypothetical protein